MKRVIIICEGETEKEFCESILAPFLIQKNIHVQSPLIKKSMGGIVKWEELRKEIQIYLKNENSVYVTTFIDYYGIHSKFNFPKWKESELESDKNKRMTILESGMSESIDKSLRNRFIPYMQLHEFEGLLFNEKKVFYEQIPKEELIGIGELDQVFEKYNNPEMINDTKETSPSHRLERIIKGYNKIVYGNILAEAIGLEKIRNKSPRFNQWLCNIEQV